ncbi:prefoldin subunit 6 [Hyalella azteca]|uniref:Probable prefoldin subunit 6 n=1 Tax=Hyalella azteca TaxID=294128 RepID=A0A8B7N6W7_HYAAZ|nr:prefoldin subunit 6 [Hyalella azteca]
MTMGPEALQKKLEEESEGFKKLQKEISKTSIRRSQLDSQLNENNLVKAEVDLLEESDVVYKLIGPALIRQDLAEAKSSVDKRIEYITNEIKRHDSALEKLEKEQNTKREGIMKLQQQLQQLLTKAAAMS